MLDRSSRAGRRWSWVEMQALGPDLATGLRAALVTVIPLVLSIVLARRELTLLAFGGWFAGGLRPPRGLLHLLHESGALLAIRKVGGLEGVIDWDAPAPW